MRPNSKTVTPLWDRKNLSEFVTIKHFLKCDGLQNGYLADSKGDVIAAPQSGYEFQYDSTLNAVKSTATAGEAREPLVSGSWASLEAGNICLLFHAGYLDSVDGSNRTLRLSFGDLSGTGGFGMSDGNGTTLNGHSIAKSNSGLNTNGSQLSALSTLGDLIHADVGQGGYFYRYAVYQPATLMSSAAHNGTTGVAIATNDTIYTGSGTLGATTFDSVFRTHGVKHTGILIAHMGSVPSDLAEALFWMAAEWKRCNRVIWPYWT